MRAAGEYRSHDLLDRFRLDVEVLEAWQGPARHVVHPEKINLACRQRRARQKLEQPRQDLRRRLPTRRSAIPTSSRSVYTFTSGSGSATRMPA
jgi:hypothetical protein